MKRCGNAEKRSEEWMCAVDRGGLIHVTDSFFDTLYSIECVVQGSSGRFPL